jgi:hypothetical protein
MLEFQNISCCAEVEVRVQVLIVVARVLLGATRVDAPLKILRTTIGNALSAFVLG